MNAAEYCALIILFFITSAVGVVTGSNSLITVPVMLQFGIDAKQAVATNMFGLTFMSIGASIPFLRGELVDRKRMPSLIVLTIIGSAIGAAMVGFISKGAMPLVIAGSMLFVIGFMLVNSRRGLQRSTEVGVKGTALGYVLAFLLAIYGGLYSGGYVTMLTGVFVALLGMTFTEAVANTKIVNVFSSLVATVVFMYQGLVDYRLGLILAATMFTAAYIGAKIVTTLSDVWLRRMFLAVAAVLAVKTLIDVVSANQ